jgi:hypothetical protein
MMEVRFFLTGKDLWRLGTFHWRRSRPLRQIIPVFILLIALILMVIGLLVGIAPISPSAEAFSRLLMIFLGFLVLCLLAMLLIPTADALRQRVKMDRAAVLLGEHLITISPAGFRHRTNQEDALIPWHIFKEITADQFGLYFCIPISSTPGKIISTHRMLIHAIPRQVFATPQEAETFLGWAQTYWANSQATPPAGPAGPGAAYERWG